MGQDKIRRKQWKAMKACPQILGLGTDSKICSESFQEGKETLETLETVISPTRN